jgi:HK97 family phage portal protein
MNWLDRAARQVKRAPTTSQLLAPWQTNRPMDKEWDSDRAIREGFKVNPWVYRCVQIRAESAASLPWRVMVRSKPGDEWTPEPGHPLETLLEYPNPQMTRQDLIEALVQHLDLGGNGIWTMIFGTSLRRASKIPVEFWPVNPGPIKPVRDRVKFISEYEYWRDGVRIAIPAEDVIHFKYTDPANPYWGMGRLQAAAMVVDTDVAASSWNKMSYLTRAIPDMVFTFDRTLDREEWETAREEIRKNYTGSRQPWVMGNNSKVEMLSWKPTEMDFIESRKMTRQEICAAFGVSLVVLGIGEDATLANAAEYHKAFWKQGVIPTMDGIKGVLNRVLVPFFGDRETLMLDYDTSAVTELRPDMKAKGEVLKLFTDQGIPLNAAIEELDLDFEPVDGGDIGYIDATKIPLNLAAELAEQQQRMGEATIENTEASTEPTLKPVPPAKDPNKPTKPAA